MCYETLVEDLRRACSVRLSHQYYAAVARELEDRILDRTDQERARLKDDLLPFVLTWYKALVCDRGSAEFNAPAALNAIAEFVDRAKNAGYDYPEWDGVSKSFRAYKAELMR